MAQNNPFDQFDSARQPVPVSGIKPIIAAPTAQPDPYKPAAEARAQTGTEINLSEEGRAGRKEKFDYAKDLRNEFRKAPETVNYETVIRQFSSALGAQATPTGDQALITAYAKMLDPGSVVREQEFNTVAAGDSKLGAIVAKLQKEFGVEESGLIRPQVRARVLREMKNLADNYRAGYDRTRTDYEGLAGNYGIDPQLVLGTRIDDPYKTKIETLWKEKGVDETADQGTPLQISSGENFSTENEIAYANALSDAVAQGATVQDLVAISQQYGARTNPEDVAKFQMVIEAAQNGKVLRFTPTATGVRNPISEAAGEFLMTPTGTAVVGATNAATLGGMSLLGGDKVQGLESLNPKAAIAGEIAGSIAGTGLLAKGAQAGLKAVAPNIAERAMGGGMAGAIGREVLTEGAYGGLYAANTGQDPLTGIALGAVGSLGGRAIGAGARRVAPAAGRAFGRGANDIPPDGIPPSGGPGLPPDGAPPAGGGEPPMPPGGGPDAGPMPGEPNPDIINRRLTQAGGLPVPVSLTRGAATRDAEQLAFEKEQLFGVLGGPLRKRAEENNLQALGNFDQFIDQTGAKLTANISDTGNAVIKALTEGYDAAKNKVRVAYKRAEDSPGAQEPVEYADLKAFVDDFDEATIDLAPVLKSVKQQLTKNDPEGTGQISVATMENIRKIINNNSPKGTASAVYGGQMKGIVDALTEGKGGELYQQARRLRIEQARKFENREIVSRLVSNIRNMDDPKVAADEVFKKSILGESPEDIRFLRRTLRTSGPDGRQAWAELQGATIRDIAEKASQGTRMTADNLPVISADALNKAIRALDQNGRLEAILNPKMAQQLRDLRDVVMYVNTVPPGTSINNSGTGRTIQAMLGEMAVTGTASTYLTGSTVPVPLVTGFKMMARAAKDREIKKKIMRSLLPPEPR